MKTRLPSLLLLVAATGCTQVGPGTGEPRRANPDLITAAEILSSPAPNAYELITALRPRWLRQRATGVETAREPVQVYVDGMPAGELGVLREIGVTTIDRMQRLDGLTATQRFGTDHGGGAILIFTKR